MSKLLDSKGLDQKDAAGGEDRFHGSDTGRGEVYDRIGPRIYCRVLSTAVTSRHLHVSCLGTALLDGVK